MRLLEITKRKLYCKDKKDDGLDDDCDIINTLTAVLGAFILSNSRGLINTFIRKLNGFYNNSIY